MQVEEMARQAREASRQMAFISSEIKNNALIAIKDSLIAAKEDIISANRIDRERSEKENLAAPLLKRLKFEDDKIKEVCNGISSLIDLDDPVGIVLSETELDDDMLLKKVSCPIGVIGMIFESRPDALVQISSLCLKSGNAVLLKGGSEAAETNRILRNIIHKVSVEAGMPEGWCQLLESREEVGQMLKMDKYVNLIIPRGSNQFVQYIMNNSNIPVLGHADGICHIYLDGEAELEKAVRIIVDSKTQYVAVCNALETLLVDEKASEMLVPLKKALEEKGVELRGCERTCKIIDVKPASEEDWESEYLDYILSIKIVDGLEDAIDHIHQYGSGHTDAIITENKNTAEKFMNIVDSADVFWNCSTRFADGFRYGLGAEVGISTHKIHARGPVGMDGLMIYKWKIYGNGQTADDYASGRRNFTHRKRI